MYLFKIVLKHATVENQFRVLTKIRKENSQRLKNLNPKVIIYSENLASK
jgi:hypothetical protein